MKEANIALRRIKKSRVGELQQLAHLIDNEDRELWKKLLYTHQSDSHRL